MAIIEYLKDPQLVASFQQFFGVKIYHNKHFEELNSSKLTVKEKKYIFRKIDYNKEDYVLTYHNKKINSYNTNNKPCNVHVKQTEFLEQKNEQTNKHKEETSAIPENSYYVITNSFWYYLFLFGTELGDEIFYSAFIPFMFWNVDGAVSRRVVLVWAIVMTIGQMLKDIICWPRPMCPPVIRLQNKWSQEYGMPSTHAMVGLSIPFSMMLFTMNKYIYPTYIGCVVALLWCVLVSASRLYLGMHTVLDVVAGLVLATVLMIPLVPLIDVINIYIVTNFWSLVLLVTISIAIIVYYPSSNKWTPTRSDTAMVVSVAAGVHAGAWLGLRTGVLSVSLSSPPYHIVWPTYSMLGRLILRTALGFSSVIATRFICKFLSYIATCAILRIDWRELMRCKDYSGNQNKVFVDLVYKYMACFMIGLNTVYLLPQVFSAIGIERSAYYMEL